MATAKKSPAKKKYTTTRSAKPRATKTTVRRKSAVSKMRGQSFRIVSSDTPFMTFTFTKQSLYWLIFMLTVLALGLWVIYLQDKINQIYDQVDANSSQLELLPIELKQAKEAAEAKNE